MFAARVRHGKLFTERAAEVLQQGQYDAALTDLDIARSFFPDNEKMPQLIRLVRKKMQQTPDKLTSGGLPRPVKRSSRSVPSFGQAPED
jgi:hypothetical protein